MNKTVARRTTLLMAVLLTLVLPGSQGWSVESHNTHPDSKTAGIVISSPNRSDFYSSVAKNGSQIAVVPFVTEKFAGIRIVPTLDSEGVEISVSALISDDGISLLQAGCTEIESWESTPAGTYRAKIGESVTLNRLVSLGFPIIKVSVVPARTPPDGAPASDFCACGKMVAFPQSGQCMAPGGGCGACCSPK